MICVSHADRVWYELWDNIVSFHKGCFTLSSAKGDHMKEALKHPS